MRVSAKQLRVAFWGIDLVLAVAAAFFLVKTVDHLAVNPDAAPEPLKALSRSRFVRPSPKVKPYKEYAFLRTSNLFGALSLSNVAAQEKIEKELPESKLKLELLGCVVASAPEQSRAIIRDRTKRAANTYMVGDSIASDAIVKDIHETKVIISRAGKSEVLSISFDTMSPGAARRRSYHRRRSPRRFR